MKILLKISLAAAMSFSACNNQNSGTGERNSKADTTIPPTQTATYSTSQANASIDEVVSDYLQIKNALTQDDAKQAAAGGTAFVEAMDKMNNSSMTADQKKAYDDISGDAKEMAEHIGKSADRIAHQREHFEMLSKDMYDLVTIFKTGRPLYKEFCPTYNNGKGGAWISETREIKNPYLGKKMSGCGEVKEEIK
ncbi:MAG TPA: DUF3347 domain-containing protein [Flavisolibacter sp.]|nr:DUF3347 domain-containing protein [Flavisolibacter sp.]